MGLSRHSKHFKRLEAAQIQKEAQLGREALSQLSDRDLDALEDALEAGQEDCSATFEDLYRVSSEQGRRALESYFEWALHLNLNSMLGFGAIRIPASKVGARETGFCTKLQAGSCD